MGLNTMTLLYALLKDRETTSESSTPEIVAEPGTVYKLGEVSSIDFTPSATGYSEVIFISGSTAAVMTVPGTVIWPQWFDPDELETDTIYDLIVLDGELGTVMTWPVS